MVKFFRETKSEKKREIERKYADFFFFFKKNEGKNERT